MSSKTLDINDYIEPLNMNRLQGRMLYMPPPKPSRKREILFVYGQHSSLERWWGLMQEMNKYGAVTMPDLPGYGGMDSLYQLGKEPDFDSLADYLAAFIKLRYKRKRLTIVGLSIGFTIVTRMLQRYPDITQKVDVLVSVVGFAHHDDFKFTKKRQAFYKYGSALFLHRPLHLILKYGAFNPLLLRQVYHRTYNAKEKFADIAGDEFQRTMAMELELWRINDLRTWLKCNVEMFRLDNCQRQVDLPVWHLGVNDDRYFDERMVEQHFRIIFKDYHYVRLNMDSHGPSVIATPQEASAMIPPKLRRLLLTRS